MQRSRGGLSLLDFYSRRIRRLLPAALLVLLVASVGNALLVPVGEQLLNYKNIVASVFYVENWVLAISGTDYLNPSDDNLVQHYWSLSTEEQFYLVWPLLILVSGVIDRRLKRRKSMAFWVLGSVTVLSVVWSVVDTAIDPSVAYFSTFTRAWEFGAGALLTFLPLSLVQRVPGAVRVLAVWIGLVVIGASGFLLNEASPFPGWLALAPVLGTVLVIGANQPRGIGSLQGVAEWAPVQWIGDWSYAIYLWHWVLLKLVESQFTSRTPVKVQLAVGVVTLLLAWLTRRFVEKPVIRVGSNAGHRYGARTVALVTVAAMSVAMVVVSTPAVAAGVRLNQQTNIERAELEEAIAANDPCFGGGAVDNADCTSSTNDQKFVPGLLLAPLDQASVQFEGQLCQFSSEDGFRVGCSFDSEQSAAEVAFVGDSHATQWLPAVVAAADTYDWNLTTYLYGGCPLFVAQSSDQGTGNRGCEEVQQDVLDEVTSGKYSTVIVSGRFADSATEDHEVNTDAFTAAASLRAQGYAAAWEEIEAAGATVVVISNTPDPEQSGIGSVPSCIENHSDDFETACALPRETALAGTAPLAMAAESDQDAIYIDMNDLVCPGTGSCAPVIGGVLVYADHSHITATYALSLAPALTSRLGTALGITE